MRLATFAYTLMVQVVQADGTKLLELPLEVRYEQAGATVGPDGATVDLQMTPASRERVEAVAALVRAIGARDVEELHRG